MQDANPLRRKLLLACAGIALSSGSPALFAQAANDWPAKPITWLVGWGAGGSADVATRLVARRLEARLGQPIVVENRPGASGTIALQAAARAAADGYTLITIPGPLLTTIPAPSIGKEFTGVAQLARGPMVLVAQASAPWPTLKALLADAKRRPGALSYASSGNGSIQHLAGELLNQIAGTKMLHVPYKGGTQAVSDVIGGAVPLGLLGITPVLPQIRAGKLKAYAVSTASRVEALPNVPTFDEAGVPGFEASQWFVVAAPRGVPPERIHKLNTAISEILGQPEIKEGYATFGVSPMPASAEETTKFVIEEQKRWSALAKKANLTLD
ncbi:hypothetical protein D9M68_180880 [compost metagenome]